MYGNVANRTHSAEETWPKDCLTRFKPDQGAEHNVLLKKTREMCKIAQKKRKFQLFSINVGNTV